MAGEKIADDFVDAGLIQAPLYLLLRFVSRKPELLASLDGMRKGACAVLGLGLLLVQKTLELVENLCKHLDTFIELVQNSLDHRFQLRVQGVVAILLFTPADCGLGNGIEEFSRRVEFPREERLIQDRYLQHRNL